MQCFRAPVAHGASVTVTHIRRDFVLVQCLISVLPKSFESHAGGMSASAVCSASAFIPAHEHALSFKPLWQVRIAFSAENSEV